MHLLMKCRLFKHSNNTDVLDLQNVTNQDDLSILQLLLLKQSKGATCLSVFTHC